MFFAICSMGGVEFAYKEDNSFVGTKVLLAKQRE